MLRVRIHLEKVRAALAKEDRCAWSLDEVRQWLADARFRPLEGGWWAVAEKDLGQLQPDEVLEIEDADEN